MPRTIQISTSPEAADTLLAEFQEVDGVISVSRLRDVIPDRRGDIVVLQTTNEGCRAVLRVLDRAGLGERDSVVTSEPRSVIAPSHRDGLDVEGNETIWEEMAFMLRRNTNLEQNYLTLMTLAGAIAAVGLWMETLYVVVAAMIVAPAFEALTRLPFGLIGGPPQLAWRGVRSVALGYLLMAIGAAAAFLLLRLIDPATEPSLASRALVQRWSTLEHTGVILALLGGVAGATIVAAQRPVLSTGVQISLALIPSMSVAGMALAAADLPLAARAVGRWGVEVGLVLIANAAVLGLKQLLFQRRRGLG